MAKTYVRISDIVKAIETDARQGAKILADATKEYLYNKTYTNLYVRMSQGDYYKRTGRVLDSITCSFVNSANLYHIFFDGRKIRQAKGDNGDFNAHADFNMKKSPVKDLIEGLENGHPVPNANDRDGANMIKETKSWLRRKLNALSAKTGGSVSEAIRKVITIQ